MHTKGKLDLIVIDAGGRWGEVFLENLWLASALGEQGEAWGSSCHLQAERKLASSFLVCVARNQSVRRGPVSRNPSRFAKRFFSFFPFHPIKSVPLTLQCVCVPNFSCLCVKDLVLAELRNQVLHQLQCNHCLSVSFSNVSFILRKKVLNNCFDSFPDISLYTIITS